MNVGVGWMLCQRYVVIFTKQQFKQCWFFGSKTWNLMPLGMACLKGFHPRPAWCMSGSSPQKSPDDKWKYPHSETVLWDVRLNCISHYIGVWRQHIATFIVHWPIFQLCLDGERKCGSAPCQFWWEQPLDLYVTDLQAMVAEESRLSDDCDWCSHSDLINWW